jgi:D-alanine-D-alanine ligase
MEILILHDAVSPGANPDEADVLVQSSAVSHALKRSGYEPRVREVTFDLRALAGEVGVRRPALVFNLVESLEGKGRFIGVVPALLDAIRVPYTGCPAEALFLTSHKPTAKRLMLAARIPTPPWATMEQASARWEGRSIVKSAWEHASIGLDEDSVLAGSGAERLRREMRARRDRHGGEFFAERFVDGREFNLSLLGGRTGGPEVLPPAEILFTGYAADKPRVVGYRAKWHEESFEYRNTDRTFDFPRGDNRLLAGMVRAARDCWRLFGLRGYARVDFRVDRRGRPWVLEVNGNPCITPESGFTAAAARGGIGYDRMVERIINDTLRTAT